jgi:hypothetical protein
VLLRPTFVHPPVVAAICDANAQPQACPGLPDTDALRAASAEAPPHTPHCMQLAAPRACAPSTADASLTSALKCSCLRWLQACSAAQLLSCTCKHKVHAQQAHLRAAKQRESCNTHCSAQVNNGADPACCRHCGTGAVDPAGRAALITRQRGCMRVQRAPKHEAKPMRRREAQRHSVVLHQVL